METEKLTNEQRLSVALKAMHDTMLQKPIGYNEVLGILKAHHVKNVSATTVILKKDRVIHYTGRSGRGSTYCWSDGVNSNLPLAKRINEKVQKYVDNTNATFILRRMDKIQSSTNGATLFTATKVDERKQSDVETMKKQLERLEKQMREMNTPKPVPAAQPKPRRRIKLQFPISVKFHIQLRKMIYFV